MKKTGVFLLLLCMAISFTGCKFNYEDPEEVMAKFNEWAGELGKSQITDESNLIGERINEEDEYVGSYTADCDNETGRDVVFGGTSIKERKIKVYGIIKAESGTAAVRIRTNKDVVELEPDELL